jgi:alpha-glucosidase
MADAPLINIGKVKSVKKNGGTVEFRCTNGRASITAISDTLARVRATKSDKFEPENSYAIAKIPKPTAKISAKKDEFFTERLRISVGKTPFSLTFSLISGSEPLTSDTIFWQDDAVLCRKTIAENEKFYGFGEKSGLLNKRGSTTTNWNTDNPHHTYLDEALYVSIPFFIGARPEQKIFHGVFLDNTHQTHFDIGQRDENLLEMRANGGELDYYFMLGESVADVVRQFSELTGRMWMPPRWALGYHQCRWSYFPDKKVRDLAKNFRKRGIPCDAIYFDIDYMDGYRVWTWDKKRFPNPKKLIRDLRKQGFQSVVIIDPGVKADEKYRVYRDGLAKKMFCTTADGRIFEDRVWPGACVFPDFTNPRARKWWGQLHREFVKMGVAGFWNDMNEPSCFDQKPSHTMPLDAQHDNNGHPATHARCHNVYGHSMARACHEALRNLAKNRRPFVITRAAYAGIQKFSMIWCGDNRSTWEDMAMAIPQCINLSLSGVPFCGVDVGGFGKNCTGELLARWTQMGAFFPYFRNHSAIHTREQEPWAFGPRVEEICKRYIALRYALLPYLYNLFHEAATTGAPILRPLFYEFPNDAHAYDVDDQFLLGNSLLVAPILRPDVRRRAVYLPAGEWIHWHTRQKFNSRGEFCAVNAPLDELPLFVRAGTILPMAEPMQFVGEKPQRHIALEVFPNPTARGYLYEDDGESFAHEKGRFCLTRFECVSAAGQISLKISPERAKFSPEPREFFVKFHGKFSPQTKISVNGAPVEPQIGPEGLTISVRRPTKG